MLQLDGPLEAPATILVACQNAGNCPAGGHNSPYTDLQVAIDDAVADSQDAGPGEPGAPVLRIKGAAFFGGVEVRRQSRRRRGRGGISRREKPELPTIQGRSRLWFCGAWTRYGFHEDGLMSGLAVAEGLRARWAAQANHGVAA